ncbi:MAG: hypothetical protein AB1Z98_26890 [Nannocystaceae bacterium]
MTDGGLPQVTVAQGREWGIVAFITPSAPMTSFGWSLVLSSRLGLLVLALCVLAWPVHASAVEPEPPATNAAIQVTASSELGLPAADAALFDQSIAGAAERGAQEAGVALRDDAPSSLAIRISWAGEQPIDYVGSIEIRAGSEELALRGFDCQMCGTDVLLDRVRSEVALALGTVREWPSDEPEAVAASVVEPPGRMATDDAPPSRDRGGLGLLGWSGVGVATLGVATGVAGAVLWARDDRLELRPDEPQPVYVNSTRTPGIALVAVGSGALVAGASLLVVDLVRRRRSRVRPAASLHRGFVGVALAGSF